MFIKTGLKPIGLGRNLKFLKVDRIIEDVKNSIENAVTFSKAFSRCKFNQLWEHNQHRIFIKRSNHVNTYLFHVGGIQRELISGLLSPLRIIKTRTALERQKYETLHIHLYDISAFTSECGIILPLEDAIGRTKHYQTLFKRDYE